VDHDAAVDFFYAPPPHGVGTANAFPVDPRKQAAG
jgi:hypothetical protein